MSSLDVEIAQAEALQGGGGGGPTGPPLPPTGGPQPGPVPPPGPPPPPNRNNVERQVLEQILATNEQHIQRLRDENIQLSQALANTDGALAAEGRYSWTTYLQPNLPVQPVPPTAPPTPAPTGFESTDELARIIQRQEDEIRSLLEQKDWLMRRIIDSMRKMLIYRTDQSSYFVEFLQRELYFVAFSLMSIYMQNSNNQNSFNEFVNHMVNIAKNYTNQTVRTNIANRINTINSIIAQINQLINTNNRTRSVLNPDILKDYVSIMQQLSNQYQLELNKIDNIINNDIRTAYLNYYWSWVWLAYMDLTVQSRVGTDTILINNFIVSVFANTAIPFTNLPRLKKFPRNIPNLMMAQMASMIVSLCYRLFHSRTNPSAPLIDPIIINTFLFPVPPQIPFRQNNVPSFIYGNMTQPNYVNNQRQKIQGVITNLQGYSQILPTDIRNTIMNIVNPTNPQPIQNISPNDAEKINILFKFKYPPWDDLLISDAAYREIYRRAEIFYEGRRNRLAQSVASTTNVNVNT